MTTLPELKTGQRIRSRTGRAYIVKRVRRPRQLTQFEEPVYRLVSVEYGTTGNGEWTTEDLQHAEAQLIS